MTEIYERVPSPRMEVAHPWGAGLDYLELHVSGSGFTKFTNSRAGKCRGSGLNLATSSGLKKLPGDYSDSPFYRIRTAFAGRVEIPPR